MAIDHLRERAKPTLSTMVQFRAGIAAFLEESRTNRILFAGERMGSRF